MAKQIANTSLTFLTKYSTDMKKLKVLLLLVCLGLYGNSLFNKYALDDDLVVTENVLVKGGISNLGKIFVSHYSNKGNQNYEYRPLVIASFAIEYQFFGLNPHISHLISILLYGLVLYSLFVFLKNLLINYHTNLALLITLIFAFLPVHTEVVDNIKCRDELLSLLFMLISSNFILKFHRYNQIKYILLAFLFVFLSLLSKISALPMIILTPLMIAYTDSKANWKKMLLVIFVLVLSYGLFLFIKKSLFETPNVRDFKYFENPLYLVKYNLLQKIPIMLYCMGFYLKLLLIPFPLVYYYGFNQIPLVGFDNAWVYLVLILLIFYVYVAFKNLKNRPLWILGVFFFLVSIFPFCNLLKPAPGIVAERFLFTSSIGFALFLAPFILNIITGDLLNKYKIYFYGWVGISSLIILNRNTHWKDVLTLYTHDIEYLENSAKAHSLLAVTSVAQIDKNKNMQDKVFHAKNAISHFKQAIEIYPGYTVCINNLGSVYYNYFNDYISAKPLFMEAIKQDTVYYEAIFNLASTYEKLNMTDSAIYYYKTLGLKNPDHQNGLINLTRLLVNLNKTDDALNFNKRLVKLYPNKITPYVNLANINLVNRDSMAALPYLESAYKLDPSNAQISQYINVIKSSLKAHGN